ncbi:MAG: hypothetical protein J6331_10395, partial [Lentisphaeria bacterium]|nr:hypothetical protein [Lentisphaeria bacterium]
AGVNGHITLGDGSTVAGASGAQHSTAPGTIVMGLPAESKEAFVERLLLPARMKRMTEKVKALEAKLALLEEKLGK